MCYHLSGNTYDKLQDRKEDIMSATSVFDGVSSRRRAKVSLTIDARLLTQVDSFVRQHPGTDRSKVVDAALVLWYAQQQERAMEAQFQAPDAPEEEWASWKAIRTAAAQRTFADRT